MVVYGLLTYEDGCVFIPNKELMDSFADSGIDWQNPFCNQGAATKIAAP